MARAMKPRKIRGACYDAEETSWREGAGNDADED